MTNIEKRNSTNIFTIKNNKYSFGLLSILIITSGYLIFLGFDSLDTPRINDFSYSPTLPLNIPRIIVLLFFSGIIMLFIEELAITIFPKTKIKKPSFILLSLLPPASSIILCIFLVIVDISLFPSNNEWDETQSLLKRSIHNQDAIGANQFYSELLVAFDYNETNKNSICSTTNNITPDALLFAADVFSIEKNYEEALKCIDRAMPKIKGSDIINQFRIKKYKIFQKTEEYTKAFIESLELKKTKDKNSFFSYRNNIEGLKLNNTLDVGHSLINKSIEKKDATMALEILELLLIHEFPNQKLTQRNICDLNNNLPPELLVLTSDIFFLKGQQSESKQCLKQAVHNLRYNRSSNLFTNKVKMEGILQKLDRPDYKIISNET